MALSAIGQRISTGLGDLYGSERGYRRTMLACDDKRENLDALRTIVPGIFTSVGIETFVGLPSGEEAVDYLRDQARRNAVAIILSDRDMWQLSGPSLAMKLRGPKRSTGLSDGLDEQRIPFILASAAAEEGTRSGIDQFTDTLMELGIIDAALNKPFGIDQLLEKVATAIEARLRAIKIGRSQ